MLTIALICALCIIIIIIIIICRSCIISLVFILAPDSKNKRYSAPVFSYQSKYEKRGMLCTEIHQFSPDAPRHPSPPPWHASLSLCVSRSCCRRCTIIITTTTIIIIIIIIIIINLHYSVVQPWTNKKWFITNWC